VNDQQTGSARQIHTRTVILATGSVPAQPAIAGIDLPGVIGTEEAIELRDIPPRLAIAGNQPWDIELAQCFHTLGSQVTLITCGWGSSARQLLPQADHEIAQRLAQMLRTQTGPARAGIELCRGAQIDRISKNEDETLTVTLNDGDNVVCDKLIAARRLPNSVGLGVRELGIVTDHGAIRVNERLQTHLPGVYAVGDVAAPTTERPTASPAAVGSHKATAEGIVAAENAMGLDSALDYESIPYGLHTWPEVAWVGLTEERAEALGIEYKVGRAPLAINPYALILNQTSGVCKLVIGRYGKILGAHVIAPGAIDLINALALAMLSEATVRELMRLVPLHPCIGEALVDAAMDAERRSLHLFA
jgi:dihydrolipoamide dehydrogenase